MVIHVLQITEQIQSSVLNIPQRNFVSNFPKEEFRDYLRSHSNDE